jgi:hypothetical protein
MDELMNQLEIVSFGFYIEESQSQEIYEIIKVANIHLDY